jgi:FtsZ-interacting cell division protein YlmF
VKYIKEDPDMALGDVLHRLGSIIGLYPEYQEPDDLGEDFEDTYEDDLYDEADVRRASGRSNYASNYSVSAGGSKGARTTPLRSTRSSLYDDPPPRRTSSAHEARDNVVQMPMREKAAPASAAPAQPAAPRHSEMIVYVRRKEDAQQIISYVLEGRSVILNCEVIDDTQCQRVIDMLAGAAFAIEGRVQRVSHRNYLFAPSTVEIVSGEGPAPRYSGG